MAKLQDASLREKIRELHSTGLSDGKIAKQLGERVNRVHWYRYYVMGLKAHQTKRVYGDHVSKLKGYIIRGVKSSAKRRGLEFNLIADDIDLVSVCPLLNVPLSYKNFDANSNFNGIDFATVDRIDNTKGYVKGNVWIISRLANNMKSAATLDQLKTFSQNVLKNMI